MPKFCAIAIAISKYILQPAIAISELLYIAIIANTETCSSIAGIS